MQYVISLKKEENVSTKTTKDVGLALKVQKQV